MRVQLLCSHSFQLGRNGEIRLKAGSIIGANPGDFPVASITNFGVTTAMVALDGAATTAIATETTRTQNASSGKPAQHPHGGYSVNGGYENS